MLVVTTGAGAALAGALGLLLGSFLNVVAYRLPRGESLAVPASHCPGCDTPIKPYDNVPVAVVAAAARPLPIVRHLDRLALSARGALHGAADGAHRARDRRRHEDVWLGLAFVILLVPVTVIDIDFRIIPNKLMLAGTVGRARDPPADRAGATCRST